MTRAIFWLALVAVAACVAGVQAGPAARELQATLNRVSSQMMAPVSHDLDVAEAHAERLMADALDAQERGGALWESDAFPAGHSFAEQDVDADLGMDLSVAAGAKKSSFKSQIDALVKRGMITSAVAKSITAIHGETSSGAQPAKKTAGGKKKAAGYDAGTAAKLNEAETHAFFAGKGDATKQAAAAPKVPSIALAKGKNSQCFACQYFLQRTLGALLGPFYSPEAASAPTAPLTPPNPSSAVTGTPRPEYLRPSISSGILTSLGNPVARESPAARTLILSETSSAATHTSFLEISSIVKESFYEPTAEEAVEQYRKWAAFLPEHMAEELPASLLETSADAEAETEAEAEEELDAEAEAEADAEAEAEAEAEEELEAEAEEELDAEAEAEEEGPAKTTTTTTTTKTTVTKGGKKGKKEEKPTSVNTGFKSMFGHDEKFAIRAFFTNLCHRRIPTEWKPVCRGLWGKLTEVVEELAVGDRPDEVCMRHNFCDASTYIRKRPHSVMRKNDDAN